MPEFAQELREISVLSVYAVEARYPGDNAPVSEQDISEALALASLAVESARQVITA